MAQIKVMILIAKKEGITNEQFRHHYETVHAPLAMRLLPMVKEYRRNFIDRDSIRLRDGSAAAPDFDVVTEMVFASEQDYAAFKARIAEPEVMAQIRADEANFLDGRTVRHTMVEECRSAR
jgi:uncharacterized protein (TIGR02118 family)